jgi:DNA-binding CsgD family transcriptional regulator
VSLLGLDSALCYGLCMVDGRARVDRGIAHRVDRFVDRFDDFLSRAPAQFGLYDPVRPAASQRNRALRLHEIGSFASTPLARELYPVYGLFGKPQLRVLVCQGPALLGWVGGWRDSEFADDEARAFEALVPSLRRRLKLQAWAGSTGLHLEALMVAMDAIGAPAFLARLDGYPVHANAHARGLLELDGPSARARLARAVRGADPSSQVSPIRAPGVPTHFLVVLPAGDAEHRVRLARAAERWSLTPRQAEVLALVVQGEANKTIAATLECSVRTVEVHVTALFEKAQCESRAELGARFWQTRS